MIPSILCYVPPSVELLERTTPSFQTHDPTSFHTRLTPLLMKDKEQPKDHMFTWKFFNLRKNSQCKNPSESSPQETISCDPVAEYSQ